LGVRDGRSEEMVQGATGESRGGGAVARVAEERIVRVRYSARDRDECAGGDDWDVRVDDVFGLDRCGAVGRARVGEGLVARQRGVTA